MLLGFVESVVDVVVGSLVVRREVLLSVAIVFFWAEADTALMTDVLDVGTTLSAVVRVGVTVDVTLDVTVDFSVDFTVDVLCLTVAKSDF